MRSNGVIFDLKRKNSDMFSAIQDDCASFAILKSIFEKLLFLGSYIHIADITKIFFSN